jgi:butyrate kinase
MDAIKTLAINPGSTSTKIAVFENMRPVFQKTIRHSSEELSPYTKITDQYTFRKQVIVDELIGAQIPMDFTIIMGRGGLVKPIESGVYEVNETMVQDLRNSSMREHASSLGGLIARDIADSLSDCKAYIADPVVVDELQDLARYSGHPDFPRISIFHALNQKAVARTYAKSIDRKYEDINLIVVHLGGGISVGAHQKGRVVDVNQALDGEGPFSPERSGTLPAGKLVDVMASGVSQEEMRKKIVGQGGLVAYMGTNSAVEVEQMALNGDKKASEVYQAMAYQVAKEIGAASAVLKGQVDAIILTGGIAYSDLFIQYVTYRIAWIAPVRVFPGEDEMRALAQNAYLVATGEISPKNYV